MQAEPEPDAAPPETDAPAPRRKWNNPALEGLPLLDDDEPAGPAAREPLPPTPAKPPARRKPKKTSANDMERLIALAEANQPELLPPD